MADPDLKGSADLLPAVYQELRRLANVRLAKTPPGNTLQPTALVHEVYLRLSEKGGEWNHPGHFFAAASEAMRQILVEQARRKASLKRGGAHQRVAPERLATPMIETPVEDVLALHDALARLEIRSPEKAQIVKLRYFGGLGREETAAALEMPLRTLDRHWRYLLAWLHREVLR
jgi:RNA polymerase sigma factor (TIGR02999 family)